MYTFTNVTSRRLRHSVDMLDATLQRHRDAHNVTGLHAALCRSNVTNTNFWSWLGPFYGAIAVPSVTRCRQRRQQRQRVTEGTAMAPWNGPPKRINCSLQFDKNRGGAWWRHECRAGEILAGNSRQTTQEPAARQRVAMATITSVLRRQDETVPSSVRAVRCITRKKSPTRDRTDHIATGATYLQFLEQVCFSSSLPFLILRFHPFFFRNILFSCDPWPLRYYL